MLRLPHGFPLPPTIQTVEAENRGLSPDQDSTVLEGIRSGDPAAAGRLFDAHAEYVECLLMRVLGPDPEIADLLQEVFARALAGCRRFRGQEQTLRPWLARITVYTARECIRRRQRRRWIRLEDPRFLPDAPAQVASPELQEILRRAYRVLDMLPARERIPFALRFIEGMDLQEVAALCGVSKATVKRRLTRARGRFEGIARHDPLLHDWVDPGHEPGGGKP